MAAFAAAAILARQDEDRVRTGPPGDDNDWIIALVAIIVVLVIIGEFVGVNF